MDKRDNPFFSYADLDSQRLKETFFSPPKKKRKKKTHKKKFLVTGAALILILAVCLFFFTRYDFLVISRQMPNQLKAGTSLFSKDMLESVIYNAKDEKLIKKENALIHLTIPKDHIAITFNLKKPIDLRSNSLSLYLKKSGSPLSVAAVVKDTRFFSNSLNPLTVEITQNGASFVNVPISFSGSKPQNTNLYQIKQITLYFYPQDKEKINWILIKDLVLI